MFSKKTLVIAGFIPRFFRESLGIEHRLDRLVDMLTGRTPVAADAPGPIPFGGRPIAERDFINALVTYGTYDEYCILGDTAAECVAIERDLCDLAGDKRLSVLQVNDLHTASFEDVLIHSAYPNPSKAIALRERFVGPAVPIHFFLSGLSDVGTVMPGIQMLFACGQSFDCITPVSRCNRRTAERLFDHVTAYLEQHWKVTRCFAGRFTKAQLGIDCASYQRDSTAREKIRGPIGVADTTTVFLYLGRLGPHYKADLVPLIHLFCRKFVNSGQDALLVLAGFNDGFAGPLAELVTRLGAEKYIKILPDVNAFDKRCLYSMADVFVSPSDNIQEAFGLTLIEAMAAGLPVIASDWDGYRESVANSVNGLLVKTFWNAEVNRSVDASGIANGMDRHLYYAQNVCIDMREFGAFMLLLASDHGLRERMGNEAHRMAERYSWSKILPLLEEEWDLSLQLSRLHRAGLGQPAMTLYGVDICKIHDHYPTALYSDSYLVGDAEDISGCDSIESLFAFMDTVKLHHDAARLSLNIYFRLLGRPPQPVGGFAETVAAEVAADKEWVKLCLFRLVKYGLLTVIKPTEPAECNLTLGNAATDQGVDLETTFGRSG